MSSIEVKTNIHQLIDRIQDEHYLKDIYDSLSIFLEQKIDIFDELSAFQQKRLPESVAEVFDGNFLTNAQMKHGKVTSKTNLGE